jgi:arabinofuranosyltransferase
VASDGFGSGSDPRTRPASLRITVCAAIAAAIALGVFAERAVSRWDHLFDDAFISFRYSRHLAAGQGLTWNVGEPPTEGYSSVLHVVGLAPLIRAGADPLLATRVLSLAAVLAMAWLLAITAVRRHHAHPVAGLLAGGLVFLIPSTGELWLVGLETVLYSAALLGAFMAGLRVLGSARTSDGLLFGALLLLAVSLRPEGALLFPSLVVVYLARHRRAPRAWRPIIIVTLLLLVCGTIYLGWKQWYFGQLLPNPFYVKVGGTSLISPRGLRSVGLFLLRHAPLGCLLLFGLAAGSYRERADRWALAVGLTFVGITLLSFLHIDTLMDIKGRFLYPLAPVVIYLSLPAFVSAWNWLEDNAPARPALLAGGVLAYLSVNTVMAYQLAGLIGLAHPPPDQADRADGLMRREHLLARQLAQFPGIRRVRIAFGDSGVIPYFTESIWLDRVGLNDSFIARTRDRRQLVDYVFNWRADVMILASNADDTWIENGHGPLGNLRSWSDDARWDRYEYAGTCRTPAYDLQLYVWRESPVRSAIQGFLESRVVDGRYSRPPAALGTYVPDGREPLGWVARASSPDPP